jgi:hypothetical protein
VKSERSVDSLYEISLVFIPSNSGKPGRAGG